MSYQIQQIPFNINSHLASLEYKHKKSSKV